MHPAGRPLRRVMTGVSRNDRAVGKPHDQGRVILAPVRIDQKARIGGQHGRRPERARQTQRQAPCPDVVADVATQLLLGKTQRAIAGGECIGRMVAKEKQAAAHISINALEGCFVRRGRRRQRTVGKTGSRDHG